MKYDWSKERVENAVKQADSYSETLEILGIPKQGNNLSTLKRKIQLYNIDVNHFTLKKHYCTSNDWKYIPAKEYLNNTKYIQSGKLKTKLVKEGILENKCACCGISEWNGKPIVLQLHHIDGNHNNNNLENLQILCPNCHSQTENYCGNSNKVVEYNTCELCGEKIGKQAKYCVDCAHFLRRKVNRPTKEELIKDKETLKSFVAVGKKYGVSDSAIRKWFKWYGVDPAT